MPDGTKPLRSLISGSGGRTIGITGVQIDQARLELFRRDGSTEFTAAVAEDCRFDLGTKLVTSGGPLTASTGDGRLSIQGRGFAFSHEAMALTVSNDVTTTLVRASNTPPMTVTAATLDFSMRTNRAVYRGGVVAEDAEVRLSTGELTVALRGTNAGLDSLLATGGVEVNDKQRGGKLRAENGRYDGVGGTARFDGAVEWAYAGYAGRSDTLEVEQRTTNLVATGAVELRLPRSALAGGLPSFTGEPPPQPAKAQGGVESVIVAKAARFESKDGWLTLSGKVRIAEDARLFTCETLRLRTLPGGGLAEMLAEGGVVASEGARRVSSERAVYTGERNELEFIGSPQWTLDAIEGSARTLRIDTSNQWVRAESDVRLRITATNGLPVFTPGQSTNAPAAKPSEPRVIEVESGLLELRGREVVFDRDVRARELPRTGSEARLESLRLELWLTEKTQQIERLRAPAGFVAERGTPGQTNGPAAHHRLTAEQGTALLDPIRGGVAEAVAEGNVRVLAPAGTGSGDRAVYRAATDEMTLTGRPSVQTPRASIRDAAALIWSPARNSLRAIPPYTMVIPVDAANNDALKKQFQP